MNLDHAIRVPEKAFRLQLSGKSRTYFGALLLAAGALFAAGLTGMLAGALLEAVGAGELVAAGVLFEAAGALLLVGGVATGGLVVTGVDVGFICALNIRFERTV
jgi:hypothetical protein